MGLSNEERYEKIVWAVKAIVENGANCGYHKIEELTQGLWETILPTDSNSALWIMGGEWDSSYLSQQSLLSIAFSKWHDTFGMDDEQKEFDKLLNKTNYYSLERLAPCMKMKSVVTISQWLEQLFYALDRYDDKFAGGLSALSKKARMLQIEIFLIIQSDERFYKLWMLAHILDKCRKSEMVEKISDKQYWHHDLKLSYKETHRGEELQAAFTYIQTNKLSDEMALLIMLALVGGSCLDHSHKEILKIAEEYNVDTTRIKELLLWCKSQHKEAEKKQQVSQYCELTGQKIY